MTVSKLWMNFYVWVNCPFKKKVRERERENFFLRIHKAFIYKKNHRYNYITRN